MRTLAVGVIGIGWLMAAPVLAHHSFSAEFDIEQPIALTGTLTELQWVNPHGWIYVDVTGADGSVVNWAVEMGSPTALLRGGAQTGRLSAWPRHRCRGVPGPRTGRRPLTASRSGSATGATSSPAPRAPGAPTPDEYTPGR